jgi:GNAT superfamily N-acetyltransferase
MSDAPATPSRRPIPSLDLIDRTLAAEDAYTLSRLRILERIPGNPIGVSYRMVGDGALALMARHLPSPSFNSVRRLRSGHAHHIEPLVRWYRENGVNGRFEMVPGLYHADLGRELSRLGHFQSDFHASLIADADLAVPPSPGVAVERVADQPAMDDFLEAYVAGWTIPQRDRERFMANVRPWLAEPGWSLYVARIDGHAAAAAILYVHHGVGYCADAATDPAFCGRGLHMALLRRRIADARAAGADVVCSGAAFLSTSHRNMERAGMRLQFTRSIWTACATTS